MVGRSGYHLPALRMTLQRNPDGAAAFHSLLPEPSSPAAALHQCLGPQGCAVAQEPWHLKMCSWLGLVALIHGGKDCAWKLVRTQPEIVNRGASCCVWAHFNCSHWGCPAEDEIGSLLTGLCLGLTLSPSEAGPSLAAQSAGAEDSIGCMLVLCFSCCIPWGWERLFCLLPFLRWSRTGLWVVIPCKDVAPEKESRNQTVMYSWKMHEADVFQEHQTLPSASSSHPLQAPHS